MNEQIQPDPFVLKKLRRYRLILWIEAALFLAAGIAHGLWSGFMAGYPLLQDSPVQLQTMQLLNSAITLFLLISAVAACLVAVAKQMPLLYVRVCTLVLLVFWVLRFGLELIMPLQIPFLTIVDANGVIRFIMVLNIVILALPLVAEKIQGTPVE